LPEYTKGQPGVSAFGHPARPKPRHRREWPLGHVAGLRVTSGALRASKTPGHADVRSPGGSGGVPISEFHCEECDHSFEELESNATAIDSLLCHACGSPSIRKKVSLVASQVRGSSSDPATGQSCATGA